MTTRILKVILWGREVGRLSMDLRRGLPYFEFSRDWVDNGLDISPLNASIRLPQSLRPIYGASEKIYQKLPPFLADSLPDAWGNELFEQWRQPPYDIRDRLRKGAEPDERGSTGQRTPTARPLILAKPTTAFLAKFS